MKKEQENNREPKKTKPVHEGHRARMRERYLTTGLNGFQAHEMLEMLLFYAIPRKDTNALAHSLLDRFGSLERVFAAEPHLLKAIPGMNGNAVVLFRMLRDLYHHQIIDSQLHTPLGSGQLAGAFFSRLYQYEQREIIRAAFLDDQLRLLNCVVVDEGHPTASELYIRQLTDEAVQSSGNLLILAHNHPQGRLAASAKDISATRLLAAGLRRSGISMVDHIILAGGEFISLREKGVFIGV